MYCCCYQISESVYFFFGAPPVGLLAFACPSGAKLAMPLSDADEEGLAAVDDSFSSLVTPDVGTTGEQGAFLSDGLDRSCSSRMRCMTSRQESWSV